VSSSPSPPGPGSIQEAKASAQPSGIPKEFALEQNYPNPFNPETEIKFALPKSGNVTLKIYNINGQEIATLVNENRNAGYYKVKWNGKDKNGKQVASGIYLYKIQAGKYTSVKKMTFLK
jgi:hypothetical protein